MLIGTLELIFEVEEFETFFEEIDYEAIEVLSYSDSDSYLSSGSGKGLFL